MIESTWIADVLRAAGALYWIACGGVLIAIIYFGKGWWMVAGFAATVVAFGYLPVNDQIEAKKRNEFRQEAFARFNKYCAEKAGEKIYKKVEGVESVVVMRPRAEDVIEHASDQFWRGDPYGVGYVGRAEYKSLMWEEHLNSTTPNVRFGFQFVEAAIKEGDGRESFVEYRNGKFDEQRMEFDLESRPVSSRRSKYGFTWEDLSTDEDRKYWIAASHLKVIDLDTNEIIAERYGYMIDRGFGNTSGGRRPWLIAVNNSCPKLEVGNQPTQTRRFVIRVLNPSQKGKRHG